MKKTIMILALVSWSRILFSQNDDVSKNYGTLITQEDLKEYLSIIASDALEGRKTGTRGQKMAAAFIASYFHEIGLIPPVNGSYYQLVELYSMTPAEVFVAAGTSRYVNYGEVIYVGSADSGGEVQTDIVFAGRGTEDDFKQVDVKDKAVLILTSKLGGSTAALRPIAQAARDKGARMIYFTSESTSGEFHEFVDQIKGYFSSGTLNLKKPDPASPNKGAFIVNQAVAEKLFNTTFDKLKSASDDPKKNGVKKIKPGKVSYKISMKLSTIHAENMLGYLEGTDKKDEVVIVTAHFDHIGVAASGDDRINNGADDDGSGTVSVLEIAKQFARAKSEGHGPRRSMLFMTFVGEEQGLLGSQYYVDHPVYPLANTVVDLNIDMIGRIDPKHTAEPNYVYVIGSDKLSADLHQLSERINGQYTHLNFDYTYNDENHPDNLYRRSDHWNFAKNSVPIIFYFDGIHEDYHKPSDEVGKINFDLLMKRAQCVFYTAWGVANREDRIKVDKK